MCLKWPPSLNKDAPLLKSTSLNVLTRTRLNLSHGCSLEAIRPRALSGATSCRHRPQRHPRSRVPLSAKRTPIKSTVPQLEFGRIHLVGRSKSLRLTSFSHVAAFLESVTEKMRLVISCNRILLGFFVFLCFSPPPPPICFPLPPFSQTSKGLRMRDAVGYCKAEVKG